MVQLNVTHIKDSAMNKASSQNVARPCAIEWTMRRALDAAAIENVSNRISRINRYALH